jgi:CBS domain-containing protein
MLLPDLERALIEEGVSGFPVVEGDRLVGIVSRSDVVRQLCVEQSVAETLSDYYADLGGCASGPVESFQEIGERVGTRIERLRVKDLMIHDLITASPEEPLRDVAARLLERRVHRLPVVVDGSLVGIVTSTDLVRLIAEERVRPR